MSVNIHGNQYITVAERVQLANEENETLSITTEFLPVEGVVCKATVTTPRGVFTGTSAANPTKMIEKQSPYEVAETSAVGRALGFAGYGVASGIASADEMYKATQEDAIQVTTGTQENCIDCVRAGEPSKIPHFVYEQSLRDFRKSLCLIHQKNYKKLESTTKPGESMLTGTRAAMEGYKK